MSTLQTAANDFSSLFLLALYSHTYDSFTYAALIIIKQEEVLYCYMSALEQYTLWEYTKHITLNWTDISIEWVWINNDLSCSHTHSSHIIPHLRCHIIMIYGAIMTNWECFFLYYTVWLYNPLWEIKMLFAVDAFCMKDLWFG